MTTLLTGEDIKHFCGLDDKFGAFEVRTIRSVEMYFFRKHLSITTYNLLLNCLVDYSAVTEWNNTTSYTVGSLCKRTGIVYKCLEAHTDKRPPNNYWELAPKFAGNQVENAWSECVDKIWCEGLGETLAWAVLMARLPFINNKIQSEGVGTTVNDRFVKADLDEFKVVQGAAKTAYETALFNLQSFITENTCFSTPVTDCNTTKSVVDYPTYLIG